MPQGTAPTPTLRSLLIDPSGGLRYHLRAARYRRPLWAPFRQCVATWLQGWQPPERELILIGPNAGYTLPDWFSDWANARFKRVVALEPDRVARALLQRRFKGLPLAFGTLDCFADPHGPAQLASAYPNAAFLFSNVIGQLVDLAGGEDWKTALRHVMRSRSWASYHDVISTQTPPRLALAEGCAVDGELEQVLEKFWSGGELELHDHGTFRLAPSAPAAQYAIWSITPRQHHLIEWICTVSGQSSLAT